MKVPYVLENYIQNMIATMGMQPQENNPFGCGTYLEGDEIKTHGFFWYLVHEDHFIVTQCEFYLLKPTPFFMPNDFLYINLRLEYAQHLPPGKIVAYMEEIGRDAKIVMSAGTKIAYTDVIYVPSFYQKHLQSSFLSPDIDPVEVLKRMGDEHNWPGDMMNVLSDIRNSRLPGMAAELFYVAKAYELMSILIDMGFKRMPKKSEDYERILYVIDYINQHYTEGIKQETLVRLSNMCSTKLKKLFHQFTGFTVTDYIIARKTDQASHLLADTDLSIEQIAQATGFNTLNGFTKSFKSKMGIPPSEYRKQIKFNCIKNLKDGNILTNSKSQ